MHEIAGYNQHALLHRRINHERFQLQVLLNYHQTERSVTENTTPTRSSALDTRSEIQINQERFQFTKNDYVDHSPLDDALQQLSVESAGHESRQQVVGEHLLHFAENRVEFVALESPRQLSIASVNCCRSKQQQDASQKTCDYQKTCD